MRFLFLLLILWVPVTAWAQQATATRLSAQLDSLAEHYQLSSIAYVLIQHDSIYLADAVGVKNREENQKANAETQYRIGSITKSFVALAIMRLAEQGLLNLEQPLQEALPDLPIQNPWADTHPVLVKHLLEHTAGFRDLKLADFNHDDKTDFLPLLEVVMLRPEYWVCRWPPGTRQAYSNPGYTLLGLLIERVSGQSYDAYLQKELLEPLGMHSSDFLGSELSRLAQSYTLDGKADFPGLIYDHPAGYLHTTPADMRLYAQFLLEGTKLPDSSYFLGHGALASMLKPESITGANGELIGYGKGFFSVLSNGVLGFGHDGGIDSFLSSLAIFPSQGLAYYFSITSLNMGAYNALTEIFQAFLEEVAPKGKAIVQAPIEEDLLGWYGAAAYRNNLERFANAIANFGQVTLQGDSLVFKPWLAPAIGLNAFGNGYFSANDGPYPEAYIGREEGRMVISSSFGMLSGYRVKSGFWSVSLWFFMLVGGFGLYLLSYLVSLVNLIMAWINSYSSNKAPLIWQLSSGLLLIPFLYGLSGTDNLEMLTHPNTYTLALFFATGGFGIVWILGMTSFRYGKSHTVPWKSIPLWSGYLGWLSMIVVLAAFGLLPLTIWTF